jgi:hypothetical protein
MIPLQIVVVAANIVAAVCNIIVLVLICKQNNHK